LPTASVSDDTAGGSAYFGIPIDLGLAPVLGVCLLLALGCLTPADVRFGFAGNSSVVPYAIVVLFISLAYVCISLESTGLLTHIAYRAAAMAGRSGWRLFFATFALSSLLTVATSNDIVVLTLTPIVCHVTRLLHIDPVPYLIAQFFAANVWSAMLYIGNPTNIIVAEAAGMSFAEYSRWMTFPALGSGLACLGMLSLLFYRRIPRQLDADSVRRIAAASGHITDVTGAIFGSLVLGVCIVLIAVSFWIGIPVWSATLAAFGLSLSYDLRQDVVARRRRLREAGARQGPTTWPCEESERRSLSSATFESRTEGAVDGDVEPGSTHGDGRGAGLNSNTVSLRAYGNLSRLPWKVVPFVFCMFIMTNGLYRAAWFGEVAGALGDVVGTSVWKSTLLMGAASTVLCNVLNNQPMTILLTRLLEHPRLVVAPCALQALRFSLILGSNLGANLTFLGALAGIMWSKIVRDKGVEAVTFRAFAFYGILTMPVVLAVGCAILAAELAYWSGGDGGSCGAGA
jgi:Na+/H+ antiporter NhaD/arsenite permease-like protein